MLIQLKPSSNGHCEEEGKYADLLANLASPALICDAWSGTILDANSSLATLLGLSVDGLRGAPCAQALGLEGAVAYSVMLRKLLEFGYGTCEESIAQRGGNRLPVRISALRFTADKRDLILQLVGAATHRIDARQGVQEKMQAFTGPSSQAVFVTADDRIVAANETCVQLLGYELPAIVGADPAQFVVPEHRQTLKRAQGMGGPTHCDVRCIRSDGTTFSAEITSDALEYNGRPATVAVLKTVADRGPVGAGHWGTEERLDTIFNSMQDGVYVLDLDGTIVHANGAGARLFGFDSKQELIGHRVCDFILGRDQLRVATHVRTRLEDGFTRRAEYTCVRRGGGQFEAEMTMTIVKNRVQTSVQIINVTRDITEQRRKMGNMRSYIAQITAAQEEERKRIARELHDETIQSLVSLSYDIQMIDGQRNHLSNRASRQLELVQRKIDAMVTDLRRFTQELRPDILDRLGLIPALQVLTDEFECDGSTEAHTEVVGLVCRLPSETELALFRIVQEALRNVRRHAQATQVRVTFRFLPDTVEVSVADDGKGFASVEAFKDSRGNGRLGIAGMRERATLIGADFAIHSDPDKGTRVSLVVPRNPALSTHVQHLR